MTEVFDCSLASPLSRRVLLIFQGITGLGKTTLAKNIVNEFEKKDILAVAVEQDDFAKFGKKSGKKCLEHCEELMQNRNYHAILLMRNNSCLEQYNKYISLALAKNWIVHVMTPHNFLNDNLRYLAVCLFSVFTRKYDSKSTHPFEKYSPEKKFAITLSFNQVFEKAEKVGNIHFVDEIDFLRPSECDKFVLSPKAQAALEKLVELVKKEKDPFKFSETNIDVESLKRDLDFENTKYHLWREDSDMIAEKVVRLTREQSLNEKVEIIQMFAPDSSMIYAHLPVPDDVFKKLIKIVHSNKGILVNNLTSQPEPPHVTLIYQDKTTRKGSEIWSKCLKMNSNDESVLVKIDGYVYSPDKLLCFTCQLYSPIDNSNLLGLCNSGHPHITALHAKCIKPVESIDVLKALYESKSSDESSDAQSIKKFEIENEIEFTANVEIFTNVQNKKKESKKPANQTQSASVKVADGPVSMIYLYY